MGICLLLGGCEIVGMDADGADVAFPATGVRQRYRRCAMPPGTVPLWEVPPELRVGR
jgi:hypothetical protein